MCIDGNLRISGDPSVHWKICQSELYHPLEKNQYLQNCFPVTTLCPEQLNIGSDSNQGSDDFVIFTNFVLLKMPTF